MILSIDLSLMQKVDDQGPQNKEVFNERSCLVPINKFKLKLPHFLRLFR